VSKQQELPLEPLVLFVGREKVTTESGSLIRFEAHKKEARAIFHERKVLNPIAFDEVAWPHVHRTMHDLPRMFRIFACKQVFDISAVNHFVNKRDKLFPPHAHAAKSQTRQRRTSFFAEKKEESRRSTNYPPDYFIPSMMSAPPVISPSSLSNISLPQPPHGIHGLREIAGSDWVASVFGGDGVGDDRGSNRVSGL
jgi:hypothetical protein